MSLNPKNPARFYLFLKKDPVQHLFFWILVFMVVYSYFAFNAWYEIAENISTLSDKELPSFYQVVQESIFYTVVIGVPAFLIWLFYYQYRVQNYLALRFITKRQVNVWGFAIFFLVNGLTILLLTYPITEVLDSGLTIIAPKWYENTLVFLLIMLCNAGISYSKDTFEQYRKFERMRRQQQIEKQRRIEEELRFIKKQIRPHFLFNTLANLQILAKQKSDMLPELMRQLSSLLRYLLYETNESMVPLEKELDFLTSYIELEKLQLASKVDFKFEINSTDVSNKKVAPMILLVFVENCFKHYNKGTRDKQFIHINLSMNNGDLFLQTTNTYKPSAQNEDNFDHKRIGLGLSSAKGRLRLIYKDQYDFNIKTEGNVFNLSLQLPLNN